LSRSASSQKSAVAPFLPVFLGAGAFLAYQYGAALWRLGETSGAMANKFSALARDEYLGFLIRQNLLMLVAYALLALAAAALAQPLVTLWTRRSKYGKPLAIALRGCAITALLHGYFTLRLMKTRPYFVDEAEFGHWYYKALDLLPEPVKPAGLFALFMVLPVGCVGMALTWHIHRHGRRGWLAVALLSAVIVSSIGIRHAIRPQSTASAPTTPNILIIGSDSLRGDRLGCSGYRPRRTDGPAAAGVSPTIDALAAKSVNFKSCYTSIASTIEAGVQMMVSQYPQSHGIRQMYPDRETIEAAKKRVVPLASLLREKGYDTAAIGDWCAGYYRSHAARLRTHIRF
jgi:hypothetical protein